MDDPKESQTQDPSTPLYFSPPFLSPLVQDPIPPLQSSLDPLMTEIQLEDDSGNEIAKPIINYDDIPIGGGNKSQFFQEGGIIPHDDRPIGGGNKCFFKEEDMYPKEGEVPIERNVKKPIFRKPFLKKSKVPEEEKKENSETNQRKDSQETGKIEPNEESPIKRSKNSKYEEKVEPEVSHDMGKSEIYQERPINASKRGINVDEGLERAVLGDDQPIREQDIVDRPIKPSKNTTLKNSEERPIKKSIDMEDRPIKKSFESSNDDRPLKNNKAPLNYAEFNENSMPTTMSQSIDNSDDRPLGAQKTSFFSDDRPLASGKKQPFPYEMEDSTAQDLDQPSAKSEEPLSHRVKSKIFKVRQEAFEELAKLLKSPEAGEIFHEYCDILPKSINDSNPAAQEKALLAFQALLSCPAANKSYFQSLEYTEVVKTLIDKCLGQGKTNVKTVAGEILQLIFEKSLTSQNQQAVIDGIVWSLGQKNQKTICAGVGAVVDLLNAFGPKKLNFLKPFFGEVEKLAGSSNSVIRTEAINFYKEAGKWLGDVLVRPFIAGLKKAQIDELEKFFQENAGKGQPIAKKTEEENSSNTDSTQQNNKQSAVLDPYDIMDPVDVIAKFPESFSEKVLAAGKWTEKKEYLEELFKAANVVKIIPNVNSSNFSSLMALLKKTLNDPNVNVVLITVKVLGALARGLRKNLTQNCKMFFPFLLDKVKDKKTALIEEVRQTLDAFFYCIGLEDVTEELKEILNDKGSPLIKLHALYWTDKYIERKVLEGKNTTKLLNKNKAAFSELMPMMKKLTDDGNSEIRDQSLGTLGRFLAVYGDAFLGDFMKNLPNAKAQKVTEACGKIVIEKKAEGQTQKTKENPKGKEEKKSDFLDEKPNNSNKPPLGGLSNPKDKEKSTKVFQKSNTTKNLAPVSKPMEKSGPGSIKSSQSNKSLNQQSENEDPNSVQLHTIEESDDILRVVLPEKILTLLSGSTWKEKLEGLQEINTNYIDTLNDSNILEALLVLMRSKLKDWKESNLNLNKEFLSLVQRTLALPSNPFTKKTFVAFSGFVTEKIVENKKFTETIQEMLSGILECVNPKFVVACVLMNSGVNDPSKKPNPKVLTEICTLFTRAVNLVSMSHMPLKPLLEFAKVCVSNTNQPLRSSALNLYKAMYSYVGRDLPKLITDINPQVMKTILSEFESTFILKESEKTPKINFSGDFGAEMAERGGGMSKIENPLDSLPRADISNEVNKVIKKLNDPDWKVRREGIDNLDSILANSNYRVSMNGLLDLISVLKARLIEKNKNLSKGFILFTGKLAESVGKDIRPHAKTLLIPLMSNLSDKQSFIRADTLTSMDKFAEVLNPETLINMGAATFLANESPEMRGELINWILKNQDCLPKCDIKGFSAVLLNCLIDRNKDVRASSELLFEKAIGIVGLGEFRNKLQDFKPAVVQQLKPIFDKYANVAKEPEAKKDPLKSMMGNLNVNNNNNNSGNVGNVSNVPAMNNNNNVLPPQIMNSSFNNLNNQNPSSNIQLQNQGNTMLHNINKASNSEKSFKVFNNNFAAASTPQPQQQQDPSNKSPPPQKAISHFQQPDSPSYSFKPNCLIADHTQTCLLKTKRVMDELNRPWPLDDLHDDLVSDLQNRLRSLLVDDLSRRMFSLDFKKHLEAMELLKRAASIEPENLKETSDLIIKWTFVRMWGNTNGLIIAHLLGLLKCLVIVLAERSYPLFDFEARVLLGVFKEALNNDPNSKGFIAEIHECLIRIYPEEKLAHFWLDFYRSCPDPQSSLREDIAELFILKFNSFALEDLAFMASERSFAGNFGFVNKLIQVFGKETVRNYGFSLETPQMAQPKTYYQEMDNRKPIGFEEKKEELAGGVPGDRDAFVGKIQNKTSEIQSKYKMLRERTQELKESMAASKNFENKEHINYNFNFNQIIVDSSAGQANQLTMLNKLNENLMDTSKPVIATPKKPLQQPTEESFLLLVHNLREGTITRRIDSLLMIGEITASEKDEVKLLLKGNADVLASALLEVLKESFDRSKNTPIPFIQYFLNMLHKLFTLKVFIGNLAPALLFELCEELVQRLLTEDELKNTPAGNSQYYQDFLRHLNSIMLKMLENANFNDIYLILLDLMVKYRKGNAPGSKPMALMVKCVLKVTRGLEQSIQETRVDLVLSKCRDYFGVVGTSEDPGAKMIKTIINELVKILGEGIWEPYEAIREIEAAEPLVQKWILQVMKQPNQNPMQTSPFDVQNSHKHIGLVRNSSMKTTGPNVEKPAVAYPRHISPFLQRPENTTGVQETQPPRSLYFMEDSDIRKVVEQIKRNENFETGMNYLIAFSEKHPGFNVLPYFHDCPQNLIDYVTESLERIKQQRTDKMLYENRNYSKNFSNATEPPRFEPLNHAQAHPRLPGSGEYKGFVSNKGQELENLQNKINQIKMRYARNNENEDTLNNNMNNFNNNPYKNSNSMQIISQMQPASNNNNNMNPVSMANIGEEGLGGYGQEQQEIQNYNRESVLQRLNEMKSKMQLGKK